MKTTVLNIACDCTWLKLTSTDFNWIHVHFLRGTRKKKQPSNIAFKSIWFRFNFTSFFFFVRAVSLFIDTLFDNLLMNRSTCTRGQWKSSEKNLRKFCDHTLFDVGRKTCIFHIPAPNKLSARQVQVVMFFFFFFFFISVNGKRNSVLGPFNREFQ